MHARNLMPALVLACIGLLVCKSVISQTAPSGTHPEKVFIDTDIGTDIDDAFALALAMRSAELDIVGISTVSGDTAGRAKIVDEMLGASKRTNVPVAVGAPGMVPDKCPIGRQSRFGQHGRFTRAAHPQAVDLMLEQIHRFPGQITLIAIGPLTNVAALIDRDPRALRQLKRLVIMGGSVDWNEMLGSPGDATPEYNILCDIPAAQKVFNTGVMVYVMPLDSTAELKLDEVKRDVLLTQGTPLANSLAALYLMWGLPTPILYDAMPLAYLIQPQLCSVEPMRVTVDDRGITRTTLGKPNAQICLHSDPEAFFHFYMSRFR